MRYLITTKLWDGLDWLSCSKIARKLTFVGIVLVSIGVCLIFVRPDASFKPGWQPAETKIVKGGTDILLHGKVLGFLKGNYRLPARIWVELTKKADYYEVSRPIYGHGLLVGPLVITAFASAAAAVILAFVLAWHRRRYDLPW